MVDRLHVVCFGAAHWDVIARARASVRGVDSPGSVETRPGGVALNLARGLAALGVASTIVAAIGDDEDGAALARRVAGEGVSTGSLIAYSGAPTGRFVAIERADGGLVAAVADTDALDAMIPAHIDFDALAEADAWMIDANLPLAMIRAIAGRGDRPTLVADAVSDAKATRLRGALPQLDALYCNRSEAEAICATGLGAARAAAEALVARGARRAIVTDGPYAAADAGPHGVATLRPEAAPKRSTVGAGDALMAAHLAATLGGARPADALAAGLSAAARRIA